MTGQNPSTGTRFRLKEGDVIFERFDGEVVAIQLATGAYHSISGAGVDAFLMLSTEPTIAEIAEALTEKYEASAERIAEDIESFLDKLRKEALVVTRPGQNDNGHAPAVPHSGSRLVYVPPVFQAYHDLQNLLFIDPVHEVGPAGWPKAKNEVTADQEGRYQPASPSGMIFERFDDET
ncbi:MAG TPA: PqqD family protein, partial [Bryobacteraceae bacterium]|nr:PqqD family protein [Bryobacteraceae bacterium]